MTVGISLCMARRHPPSRRAIPTRAGDGRVIACAGWYTPTPRKSGRAPFTNRSVSDSLRGMSGAILSPEDRAHFLGLMRHHTPSPVHRRMKALLLLDDGRAAERVAEVLFIDAETVREHRRLYQASGVTGIERLKY